MANPSNLPFPTTPNRLTISLLPRGREGPSASAPTNVPPQSECSPSHHVTDAAFQTQNQGAIIPTLGTLPNSSDASTQRQCHMCNVTFSELQPFFDHLRSKAHEMLKGVPVLLRPELTSLNLNSSVPRMFRFVTDNYPAIECRVCNITVPDIWDLLTHQMDHKERLRMSPWAFSEPLEDLTFFYCKICQLGFGSGSDKLDLFNKHMTQIHNYPSQPSANTNLVSDMGSSKLAPPSTTSTTPRIPSLMSQPFCAPIIQPGTAQNTTYNISQQPNMNVSNTNATCAHPIQHNSMAIVNEDDDDCVAMDISDDEQEQPGPTIQSNISISAASNQQNTAVVFGSASAIMDDYMTKEGCNLCSIKFKDTQDLNSHRQTKMHSLLKAAPEHIRPDPLDCTPLRPKVFLYESGPNGIVRIRCRACDIFFTGVSLFDHQKGNNHRNKINATVWNKPLRANDPLPCNRSFGGDQALYNAHQLNEHKSKSATGDSRSFDKSVTVKEEYDDSPIVPKKLDDGKLLCPLCNVVYNTENQYNRHERRMEHKTHLALPKSFRPDAYISKTQARKMNILNPFYFAPEPNGHIKCRICMDYEMNNSMELVDHQMSQEHATKLSTDKTNGKHIRRWRDMGTFYYCTMCEHTIGVGDRLKYEQHLTSGTHLVNEAERRLKKKKEGKPLKDGSQTAHVSQPYITSSSDTYSPMHDSYIRASNTTYYQPVSQGAPPQPYNSTLTDFYTTPASQDGHGTRAHGYYAGQSSHDPIIAAQQAAYSVAVTNSSTADVSIARPPTPPAATATSRDQLRNMLSKLASLTKNAPVSTASNQSARSSSLATAMMFADSGPVNMANTQTQQQQPYHGQSSSSYKATLPPVNVSSTVNTSTSSSYNTTQRPALLATVTTQQNTYVHVNTPRTAQASTVDKDLTELTILDQLVSATDMNLSKGESGKALMSAMKAKEIADQALAKHNELMRKAKALMAYERKRLAKEQKDMFNRYLNTTGAVDQEMEQLSEEEDEEGVTSRQTPNVSALLDKVTTGKSPSERQAKKQKESTVINESAAYLGYFGNEQPSIEEGELEDEPDEPPIAALSSPSNSSNIAQPNTSTTNMITSPLSSTSTIKPTQPDPKDSLLGAREKMTALLINVQSILGSQKKQAEELTKQNESAAVLEQSRSAIASLTGLSFDAPKKASERVNKSPVVTTTIINTTAIVTTTTATPIVLPATSVIDTSLPPPAIITSIDYYENTNTASYVPVSSEHDPWKKAVDQFLQGTGIHTDPSVSRPVPSSITTKRSHVSSPKKPESTRMPLIGDKKKPEKPKVASHFDIELSNKVSGGHLDKNPSDHANTTTSPNVSVSSTMSTTTTTMGLPTIQSVISQSDVNEKAMTELIRRSLAAVQQKQQERADDDVQAVDPVPVSVAVLPDSTTLDRAVPFYRALGMADPVNLTFNKPNLPDQSEHPREEALRKLVKFAPENTFVKDGPWVNEQVRVLSDTLNRLRARAKYQRQALDPGMEETQVAVKKMQSDMKTAVYEAKLSYLYSHPEVLEQCRVRQQQAELAEAQAKLDKEKHIQTRKLMFQAMKEKQREETSRANVAGLITDHQLSQEQRDQAELNRLNDVLRQHNGVPTNLNDGELERWLNSEVATLSNSSNKDPATLVRISVLQEVLEQRRAIRSRQHKRAEAVQSVTNYSNTSNQGALTVDTLRQMLANEMLKRNINSNTADNSTSDASTSSAPVLDQSAQNIQILALKELLRRRAGAVEPIVQRLSTAPVSTNPDDLRLPEQFASTKYQSSVQSDDEIIELPSLDTDRSRNNSRIRDRSSRDKRQADARVAQRRAAFDKQQQRRRQRSNSPRRRRRRSRSRSSRRSRSRSRRRSRSRSSSRRRSPDYSLSSIVKVEDGRHSRSNRSSSRAYSPPRSTINLPSRRRR